MYRSLRDALEDWAFDIKGNSDRVITIIKEILEYVEVIIGVWTQDDGYKESLKKFTFEKAKLYNYPQISEFLEYYQSPLFKEHFNSFKLNYKNDSETSIATIYYYYNAILKINFSLEDAVALYNLLENLRKLEFTLVYIKSELISENAGVIFSNIRMVNLIRSKNGIYKNDIGDVLNLDSLLGPNGEYIREKRENVIEYISSFEELKTSLDAKISHYEFLKMRIERPDGYGFNKH